MIALAASKYRAPAQNPLTRTRRAALSTR